MERQTQRGSTEAVIVICLALALLTALGWIFWQNFIHKEPVKQDTELITVEKDKSRKETTKEDKENSQAVQTYNGDSFTFEYPKAGWKENNEDKNSIVTSNYQVDVGSRLPQDGARITVFTTDKKNAGEFKKPRVTDAHGMSNIQVLEVDGRTAYFYRIEHEGIRYKVHFQSDTLDYQIELIADGESTRAEKDVFNQVWKSFDIK